MLCFVLSCVCYAIWNFTHPEIIHQNLELLNVNNIQAMLNDPPTIHDNCPKQSQASVGSHRWDAMQVSKMDLRPPLSPMLLGKTCDAATRPTTWNKTPLRNLENKQRENINLAKTWVLLLLRGSLTCCLAKFPKLFFFTYAKFPKLLRLSNSKTCGARGPPVPFKKTGTAPAKNPLLKQVWAAKSSKPKPKPFASCWFAKSFSTHIKWTAMNTP